MKKLSRIFTVLLTCIVISGANGVQAYAYSPVPDNSTSIISPRADIIEWRYKVDNGKLYKRQYNCTRNEWIGNWVLVS